MRKTSLFFLLFMIFADEITAQHRKVRLSDVKTITLRKGEYTTGRRSSPVPQLKCVGGAAAGRFSPRVAQCTQTGHDGVDVQWKCVSEMPSEYEFGKISVTCEGFDYPEDPYVLHGSCGLEYDLEYSNKQHRKSSDSVHRQGLADETTFEKIVTYAVYAFFVFIIIYMFCNCMDGGGARQRGAPGGFGPGYPPQGPPRGPPPPYDSFPKTSGPQQQNDGGPQQQNEGPGFWTGAGLGALGGYFMGRNQGGGARQERNFYAATGGRERTPSPPRRSWSPGPSTSSATHESTGYGGTRRR